MSRNDILPEVRHNSPKWRTLSSLRCQWSKVGSLPSRGALSRADRGRGASKALSGNFTAFFSQACCSLATARGPNPARRPNASSRFKPPASLYIREGACARRSIFSNPGSKPNAPTRGLCRADGAPKSRRCSGRGCQLPLCDSYRPMFD